MPDISIPIYEAGTCARRLKCVFLSVIFAATLPLIGCSNRRMSTSAIDQVDQLFDDVEQTGFTGMQPRYQQKRHDRL